MKARNQNERIIFGLKVKQLRQEKGLSFSNLSHQSGLSVSYLNEIEKGKKFPKPQKIADLAKALAVEEKELLSMELDSNLAPVGSLLQSNFLNELPLDLFGIELAKVVEIIANAPARVGAFISTLLELSRNYALKEENFYFGALRSYLELHNNYFEDIEEAVNRFCKLYDLPSKRPLDAALLQNLLEDRFGYTVVDNGLEDYPELQTLRAVFVPKKKSLLLNKNLNDVQKAFQFGKELAFHVLELKERANTSSLLKSSVFEEVLNHSKATYFSVALHITLGEFLEDVKQFFQKEKWDGDALLSIMRKYNSTPEMFYHRLTNVLPHFFGMKKLFFMRFIHDPDRDKFEIDKELHLNQRHHPHGNGLLEHYCRRWVSLSLLQDLQAMQEEGKFVDTIVRAQRSRYIGTEDEYLCLTIARPSYPSPNRNVSVTIGLLVTDEIKDKIAFFGDNAIQLRAVNKTCERCAVMDCEERAIAPVVVQKREKAHRIQEQLDALTK